MGFVFCRCNVVGYFQKTQLAFDTKDPTLAYPTGILVFQWNKVDGTERAINDILKCSVMGTAFNHDTEEKCTPGWTASAPKIQIREANGGYTTLYYIDDAWDDSSEETEHGVPGWANDKGMLRNPIVNLGQGAWVQTPSVDAVFTIAGAVAGTEHSVGGDTSNFALAGVSFPIAFGPNDANVTWTCTPGTAFNHDTEEMCTPGWISSAPTIQIRELNGGYTTLYYCDDAWDDSSDETEHGVVGWANDKGMLRNPTIEVGGGFWMKNPNDGGIMYVQIVNPIQ